MVHWLCAVPLPKTEEVVLSRNRFFQALLSVCIGLVACHRTPDAGYLHDYAEANALLDGYRGKSGELARAQTLIDGMLGQQPDFAHAHVAKARLIMNRSHISGADYLPGALDAAEQQLRTALALDGEFCDAHVVLGHTLFRQKRYPDALSALDRADALRCPGPWRLINRADVYMELQRYDEARQVFERIPAALVDASPALRNTIETRVLGGRISMAYQLGDQSEMLARVREQLKAAPPGDAWAVGNPASSFVLAGAFDEAIDAAREALRRMEYGAAEHTLGTALYGDALWRRSRPGAGDDARASEEWSEAATLLGFDDASKDLWRSLANRDVAFRTLLQNAMAQQRASQTSSTAPSAK